MTLAASAPAMLPVLDDATRALVRLAAVVTAGDEDAVRAALASAVAAAPPVWVEELLLQTYLFAGFPRALNAMREWRRVSGRPAPARDDLEESRTSGTGPRGVAGGSADGGSPVGGAADSGPADGDRDEWRRRGLITCARVYGTMYDRLRDNIRALHPALDEWMVVEGYGKVLSRPGLDLPRRELCIVAACAAARQERQLLSHLHGALNVGVPAAVVDDAVEALAPVLDAEQLRATRMLWARVRGK